MAEIVNPYIAGAPVTEARMFFGREDVFQWIENSIAGQYADHILVIHGQRRVGKTSVLKQLGKRLPKRFIPVFFDLQGRTHTTLDHFLWWLAREIVRVLKQDRDIEVPPPTREAFTADPEFFENQFLTSLRSALGNNTLLLTFDEFDNLEESEVKEELARPLVDHLRRLMEQPNLNFIFSIGSSGRKLENMQAAYTDFFKTALYKKISFLSEEQTRNLVTRPVEGIIEYERSAVDRIFGIASGHPYFTQLTCHELFARCQRTEQRKIALTDVDAVLDDVVERGTVNLKFVWDEASDLEKWSLAALAEMDKADNRAVADFLRKNRVRFTESDLTSGLLHLREKDVLTSQNRFVIHLLRRWLQKNRPIEQVREELTEANPIANRFIEIGLEFRDSGQYEKAIEFFRQALSVSSDNLQAHTNIAVTYATQGQLEQAITEFEKALTIDDEDVASRSGLCDAHLALGDAAMKKGRTKESVLSYQRVLAINAEHLEARQRMAEFSRQRAEKALMEGKDEEALSAFAEALKFTPEDQSLIARSEKVRAEKNAKVMAEQIVRSEKEANARNWDKAIAALNDALEIAPGDESILKKIKTLQGKKLQERLDAILTKVDVAEKAGRWDTAITGLNEYLQLKPEDKAIQKRIAGLVEAKHAAWLNSVLARVDQATAAQNWDEALTALNEALRLEPGNAEMQAKAADVRDARRIAELNARLKRADQAGFAGHWDEAINLLNDGLASDPGNETLKAKLAEARKAKREAYLQAALRLANSAAQAGKWEAAVASLNEVLANEPDNTEFQNKLAEVRAQEHVSQWDALQTQVESLRDAERFEEALEAWQTYLTLHPEDRERVEVEIKQVTQEQELLDLYTKAGASIAIRDFDGAIRLLKEIIIRDENYKDASRLLTKAIESRRTSPTQRQRKKPAQLGQTRPRGAEIAGGKRIRVIAGLAVVLLFGVVGVFFGPRLWESLSATVVRTPAVTEAAPSPDKAFTEPILAYIAATPPDFQDDFSEVNSSWGDLAEGISTLDVLQDGSITLAVDASIAKEKYVFMSPYMEATDFAVEFDFYYEEGTGGTLLGVGFPFTGQGGETNAHADIDVENKKWYVYLTDRSVEQSGQIGESLKGQWVHFLVIFSGGRLSAYLNNTLLGYADDFAHNGTQLWIYAGGGQAKLQFDNIKFWNLEGMETSPALDPELQAALDTIQNEEPIYQTSFDAWDFGEPVENASIENGKLIVLGGENQSTYVSHTNFQSDRFAIKFETQILESGQGGACILNIGSDDEYNIRNMFWPRGDVEVDHLEVDGYQITIGNGQFDPSNVSTTTLVVLKDQISLFVDGELAFTANDPEGSAVYTNVTYEADSHMTCGFDNYKFWDLREMDPAVKTALATIQNEEPVYQTSFDSWEFGDPIENVKVENGKLIVTSVNQAHAGVELNRLNSDRFAVQFDLRILDSGPGHCVFETANANDYGDPTWRAMSAMFFSNGQAALSHYVHPNQYLDLVTGENKFDFSKSNTVALIFLDDQIATLVNGQIAYTAVDPAGRAIYSSHDLAANYTIGCEFDNYKLWDLREVDLSAIQTALDTTQTTAPTYQTNLDSWEFGDPKGIARVEYGKLILTSENQDGASVNLGDLSSDMFAVEFEFIFHDADPDNGHCTFETINDGIGESWRAMSAVFFSNGTAILHNTSEDIAVSSYDETKVNTVKLIILGDQIAAYINEQLAYTSFNPEGSSVYTHQQFSAYYPIVCEYDNYKFWDLSGVDFSTPTPTSDITEMPLESIQEYLSIVDHITNAPPDFEDDFSKANPKWNPLTEGISVADLLIYNTLNLELDGGTPKGKYVLSSESMQAKNFVLEFDFFFKGGTGGTTLGVGFPSTGQNNETDFDLRIDLEKSGWFIGLTDGSVEYRGDVDEPLKGQWAHLQIVFLNSQAGVFLNEDFLGHAEKIDRPGKEVWIYTGTVDQGHILIDNLKFWSLDGVDFKP